MNLSPLPTADLWAEHCRLYDHLTGRNSLSLNDLQNIPESVSDRQSIYSVADHFTNCTGGYPYTGAPLSFNPLSDENYNPSRASSIVTQPDTYSEPITRSASQLQTWQEAVVESYTPTSSPSTQSAPQVCYRPVEYHPPPIEYLPYHPPREDPEEESILKLDTIREYTIHASALENFLRTHPQHENAVAVPIIVWRDSTEHDVFAMKTRPRYALEIGDHFESFGLISGDWRITDRVKRSRKWHVDRKRWSCEEHVYAVCLNDNALYQAWIKMPASYFYPPPFTKRVKASLKKLGSLFTLHARK
ncbi:hypothetical protein DFH06DRAFT_1140703 [Mycena polygramma]|nr:hypothetical protein DFH06DRAFT_1140703 [Mycena polygramma]